MQATNLEGKYPDINHYSEKIIMKMLKDLVESGTTYMKKQGISAERWKQYKMTDENLRSEKYNK